MVIAVIAALVPGETEVHPGLAPFERSGIVDPSDLAAAQLIEAEPWSVTSYVVVPGQDPDRLLEIDPPTGWAAPASPVDELDPHLPHPWPEDYIDRFEQPFAPHVFMKNAASFCSWLEENPADRASIERLAALLVERLEAYLEPSIGGQVVVYRFEREYRSAVLEPGWASAYANARAIQGLLVLARCLGEDRYRDLAADLTGPLTRSDPDGRPRSIAFVTPDGYLWFEEAPLVGHPSPMVLNGHVTTVFALYYAYEWGHPAADVERTLLGGMASVKRYVESFRRPGEVNRYDLLDPPVADYGPERTIRQQRALHEITGDPFFEHMAELFEQDLAASRS
ncbi:MAG: hypothetical protein KY469_02575 [Actinobacteria bacterium]|nr:hypothetical protein [Actinomycetota bacterium]